MFPIPAEQTLTLLRVADYWSREVQPAASPREVLSELIARWWLGELCQVGGPSRIQVLRAVMSRELFVRPGFELGRHERIVRFSVPFPETTPPLWTEAACEAAYVAVSEQWVLVEGDPVIEPLVAAVEIDRDSFVAWLVRRGAVVPKFWGRSPSAADIKMLKGPARNAAIADVLQSFGGDSVMAAKELGLTPGAIGRAARRSKDSPSISLRKKR